MSDSYMITVPIELDTKNAREKLKAQFTSFKQDIEGELYKIRITADTKDLDKIRESLKGLKAEEIAKINIQVDRSGFDKQLLNLKNATGKSADDIGKTFKKTIQDNFESLSLDDLIQKQFDGKRYSGGRASEVVKNLYGTVTTPLPKDADFISVVRMAEAYEQLGNSLSELKQKSPREYEKLDFKESDIKNATKAFYNNIGNMMLDESVRNNFIEQINTSFQTLNENISMLMSSIIDDSKKLGDGLGGGVGQISEEVQRQVDAISTQIDDTTKKIEEMEAKLQELQTKKSKMPNFFKTITDADGNRVKLGIDDLIKQQQDEINNAKRSIEELEEKKKQLLSGSGTGGGAGTGAGSGNGTGNGNGTTTVGVEPDSTQFISKLQEQINGQYVDVDVKPKTENFVEDIKNSVSDMEPVLVPVKPDMEGFVDDIKSSISNSNIEIGVKPKIDVSQPISEPDLIGKLSSQMNEYMEKAGTSRGNGYWDQLRDSFSQLDTETKKLLNDLGLLNSEANGINTINVGANNFGGIIGNKNTLIARSNISQEYLSAADELKNKLDAAAESGVNVARILNNVYDPKNKVMFQLMETLPGTDMSTLGQNVELVNLDALQAGDEQIKKLISDLKVLYDLGLGIDVESGNLLFDKLQGFSLIDLDLKPIHNSFEELVADVMRYLDDIRAHFEDAGNQSGVGFVNGFESKFKSLLKAGNESPQKTDAQLYDEAKGPFKKAGNIDQLYEQYKILKMMNHDIQEWQNNPSGGIVDHPNLKLQGTLEQLKTYKAELLELNPQLQAVADSVDRIGKRKFEQMFGSNFPSLEKLEESYYEIGALQRKIDDASPNVRESDLSNWIADLERQKKAFIEMYEAYNKMSGGAMDKDLPGRKSIQEMREMYISLREEAQKTGETLSQTGSDTQTPGHTKSAEESSEADLKAAGAAKTRTEENRNLAESEREVDQSESSKNGTPNVGDNIGGYFSSEESTSRETSSLDSLITKLGEVTRAIDEKTQAFSQEAGVVDGVITGEVNMLDALLGEVNLIIGDLEKLADAITTLPQIELKMGEVGDDSTINTQFSGILEELKRVFANFDLPSTSGLKETIDSLKISKQNVKNLNELSNAITKMSDAFQSLGNASSGSPEFLAIQELLQNAEALKDLAKILQASQDQINKAKQAVGGKSTGGVSTEVEELRKYNQAVKEYYEAQTRLQTGKTDKKAQDELQSANALKIIEQYESKINEMQQKGIELSKQQTNAIKARQDAEEKLAATVKDYNDAQQKKAVDEQKKRIENTVSGIGKQIEKMWTVTTGKTPAYTDEITKLEGQYHELQTVISGIDWNGDAEAQLQDVQQSIRSLQANINDVRSGREFRVANDNKIASINRSMSEWMQRNSGAGDYLDQVRALQTELQKVGSMTDLDKVIQGFEGIKAAAADAGKTGKSFMDMLSGSFKNLAKYLLTFASFYRVIGYIKAAVNVVKELDTAMVEIRKVTTESAESLERFSRSSFNMADKYGTTAKQIQESTASWLRLGENFQQATESAQMSAYLLNTTEISSIDEATEDLVSISQAYKEISKSDIIDKLNNIGDHFSSSSSDLAQGLKNASAVLKTQGNDIDKALALLTAGNNITQDISKTSAGIRTIALRISGVCPNVQ